MCIYDYERDESKGRREREGERERDSCQFWAFEITV